MNEQLMSGLYKHPLIEPPYNCNMAKAKTKSVMNLCTSTHWESVWRIVFPTSNNAAAEQTLPLYITAAGPYFTPPEALDERKFTHSMNISLMSQAQICSLMQATFLSTNDRDSNLNLVHLTRTACTIKGHSGAGLCTYFNAFPASYWRYWTKVNQIRFAFQASGNGTVTLYKSNCRGLFSPLAQVTINTKQVISPHDIRENNNSTQQKTRTTETFSMILPLTSVIDGGWIWADIHAKSNSPFTISNAAWQVPANARTTQKSGTACIVITTFNREKYCLHQLNTLSRAANLLKKVNSIFCIDQGTHPINTRPEFASVRQRLGEKLRYIRQPNLGGSGGFSRGMIETLNARDGSSALLLDDDAIIEPEALLRAIQFEDYVKRPLIVGGGMFHLDDRTVLYTQAERLNPVTLLHEQYVTNHDFATKPLIASPRLHRRVNSGYNGWWLSLIPATVMRKIGFALPNFIKFDDIDYSKRAAENGFPTVSLPGVAIWHEAWHGKNESRSWQEYYNQRNRYLYALLHESSANKNIPFMLFRHCTAMGLAFIYSGIAQDEMALTDLLHGPKFIVDSYLSTMKRISDLRCQYPDTQLLPESSQLPLPHTAFRNLEAHPSSQRELTYLSRKAALSAWLGPKSGSNDKQPAIEIDSAQTNWKSFLNINSALVASPDENSFSWLRRNDRLYRHLTWKVFKLSKRIVWNWKKLHKEYISAGLGSRKMWEQIFQMSQMTKFR